MKIYMACPITWGGHKKHEHIPRAIKGANLFCRRVISSKINGFQCSFHCYTFKIVIYGGIEIRWYLMKLQTKISCLLLHGRQAPQYMNDLGHCSSAAPAVRWLPSAACAATPSFDVRSSGFFCSGRPGGLELVTRLSSWSVAFCGQFLSWPENFSLLVLLAYTAH